MRKLRTHAVARNGTCCAHFNPDFTGEVRINGDYGDGDVLGTNPPTYINAAAFRSPAPFTYGNTPRTLAHDLRNPNIFNQELSIRATSRFRASRSDWGSTCSTCSITVVFAGIQTNITNANFGRVSSKMNTPRVGQVKVRLEF